MKYAFRMKVHEGKIDEYKKRHDEIWPDLKDLLHKAGINDYSIYCDPTTHYLFAFMEKDRNDSTQTLRDHPIMKKWWAYMADIMDTHPDNSPVEQELINVFYMK